MHALTAREALKAWEQGQFLDPQGRALALLSSALPDIGGESFARLPVGQRDALLLRLRQRTFGHQLRGFARCQQCQAPLEFEIDLRSYQPVDQLQRSKPPEWLSFGKYEIHFRLPDSADLAAVANSCLDADSGREILLQRCVLKARHNGREVAVSELPEPVIERLEEQLEELDPLAELPLAIGCGRCGHQWLVLFDIAHFLWHDVEATAKKLLDEVHDLARAYGWSESEILSLSPARRRFYMSKVPRKG